MNFRDWDKRPNGDLVVYPVIGWSTVTAMKGMAGVVRLEYSTDPSMKQQAAAQLILTMPQVRELSEALANLADTLEKQLAADQPIGPRN
jgi:hypothetical protein